MTWFTTFHVGSAAATRPPSPNPALCCKGLGQILPHFTPKTFGADTRIAHPPPTPRHSVSGLRIPVQHLSLQHSHDVSLSDISSLASEIILRSGLSQLRRISSLS